MSEYFELEDERLTKASKVPFERLYCLTYFTISDTEPRTLQYPTLLEFAQALERLMDNQFVVQHTIVVSTK